MKLSIIITFFVILFLGSNYVIASALPIDLSQCETIDGVCCINGHCVRSNVNCVAGTTPKFSGCDINCTPKVTCENKNNSICTFKNGSCCIGEVCASSTVNCVVGTSPKFLGCSDSCTPEFSCVNRNSSNPVCVIMPQCSNGITPADSGKITPSGCKVYECKEENVCCESFGYGAQMIKTASTYSIVPKSECSVCKKDLSTGLDICMTGGGRNIVANSFCGNITSTCPNNCQCDSVGNIISCTGTTTPACPIGCVCDNNGNVLSCTGTTTPACPIGCTCDMNGVTKCTTVAANKDIVKYYKDMIDAVVEADTTDNPDGTIAALETLRKQIDKTIIELIEQKKSLKYSDTKDISEKITVTKKNIAVGESTTSTEGVTIESDIEGTSVIIGSTSSSVTLSQDGVTAETGNLNIDNNGVNMDNIQVKLPPKAALMRNHNLESNMERVREMKLEKEDNNVVYNIKYDAEKKILGFISATASQEIKINANTGDVISEKKPWWGFLASDTKPINNTKMP